jgi:tetratricopeptide (TPR) repeat protein
VRTKFILLIPTLVIQLLAAHGAMSQTAQVEGTVTDAGKPLPSVQLTLTNTQSGRSFKVKTSAAGKFGLLGIPFGEYQVTVTGTGGAWLFTTLFSIAPASGVASLNVDVSEAKSASGQGSAAPAQASPQYTNEQVEEIKRQNERAQQINVLIKQAQTAIEAKDWKSAIPLLEDAVTLDPENWQLYSALGDAHSNLGEYEAAAATYEKGIKAAETTTEVDGRNPLTDPARRKAGMYHMYSGDGQAYIKLKRDGERAVEAYTKAAQLQPGATSYFNLCAAGFNTGDVDAALEACDKAIAADPSKADAYFIKGSLLVANSKIDKSNRMIAPPGTAEALNKYLQLTPTGPHASDVKQMLQAIGSRVETTKQPRPPRPTQ